VDASDIKKGIKFMQDGQPYVVVDFQFVKPGKGQAFTRTRMKNMLSGGVIERNIRSGEKLERMSRSASFRTSIPKAPTSCS
jgi:elongation factor P